MTERATYRIIDANYNRAREALRVIEEYCRFALNHAPFSAQVKEARHTLCQCLSQLDASRLLVARDTPGDVGTTTRIPNQHQRRNLEDCLTAAFKRLSEALRALNEALQAVAPQLASIMETLRYQCYHLEKAVTLFAIPAEKYRNVRLYVLINHTPNTDISELTQQCIDGGAHCIQLRSKGITDCERLRVAKRFTEHCRENQVVSIINDRVDIAVASRADGVHLGLNDFPLEEARKLQLEPLIFGLTTHSLDELKKACQLNPTYVALGPAFATQTKPNLAIAGLDYIQAGLAYLKQNPIPHVVIGGITLENTPTLLDLGVSSIAVCSCVCQSPNPQDYCAQLLAQFP